MTEPGLPPLPPRRILAVQIGIAAFLAAGLCLFSLMPPSNVPSHGDAAISTVPFYRFTRDVFREEGRLPFWNPYILGGMPHLASLNVYAQYPTELASLPLGLDPPVFYWHDALLHLFIGGMGVWFLLRRRKLSPAAAFTGGLCYMFGHHLLTEFAAGHVSWVRGLAWLPWFVAAVGSGLGGGGLSRFVAAGVLLALPALTSCFQLVAQNLLCSAAWILWARWRRPRQGLLELATIAATAASLSAVTLLPGMEHYRESIRTDPADMAKAAGLYNLSLPEMLAWLLPGLFGGGVAYWGPQPFQSNSEYFGLLPLSLALVGIASRPALLWPWGFAAAAGIILAFGPSLPPGAALNLLPFFGGFRAGVRWLALTHLAIAVLAAYGFASLRERAGRRALCLAAGWLVFAAACVILAPRSPGFARTVLERRYMKENVRWFPVDPRLVAPGIRSSLESGALTGLATAAALALPVVPFASPAALAGAIWIVTAWDLRRAAVPFFASARLRDPPDPPVEMILRDVHARNTGAGPAWKRELFRISTDEYAAIVNLRMFRRLQWVNGYHSVPLRRYLGLYDAITSPPSAILPALLNVRYSLNASRGAVARHPNVMPRAYFARETVACRDIGEAIAVIKSPGWTPARIPLENPPPELAGRTWDDRGTIDLAFGRDELSARVVTRAPALLVLSETWFPAWKAEADGKRIPVLKACGALRAVAVPAGDHSIRLVYDSWRLKVGLLISALAWSLLALVPAALSFRARRDP